MKFWQCFQPKILVANPVTSHWLDTACSSPVRGNLLTLSGTLEKYNHTVAVVPKGFYVTTCTKSGSADEVRWHYQTGLHRPNGTDWSGDVRSLGFHLATLRWLLTMCLVTLLGKIWSDLSSEYSSPFRNSLHALKRIQTSAFFCRPHVYKGYQQNIWPLMNTST